VAVDRAIASIEDFGYDGPLDRWKRLRDDIHRDVLEHGVDDRGVFVQRYGSPELDASLLMVPLVGFLPPDDERVRNTVTAIEQGLTEGGFVYRYRTLGSEGIDGLAGAEGVFLMCSFWLADNYALLGRHDEAVAMYERLVGLRNDVGLLSEEYDPAGKRMLGNFPQAFSHVALVNTAGNVTASRLAQQGKADGLKATAHQRRARRPKH
jgi:GH15 family glucan-1,4-alpha-glucosidase